MKKKRINEFDDIDFNEIDGIDFNEIDGIDFDALFEKARDESAEELLAKSSLDRFLSEPDEGRENDADLNALDLYMRDLGRCETISGEEAAGLALRSRNGDRKALDRLIEANQRLVFNATKRFRDCGSQDFLDLVAEGNIGLLESVRNFDSTRGAKFSTYAVYGICGNILNHINKKKNSSFAPFDEERMSLAPDEEPSDEGPIVEDKVAEKRLRSCVQEMLARVELNGMERAILHEHLCSDNMSLQAIADTFRVDRASACRSEASLLKKLRDLAETMPELREYLDVDKTAAARNKRVCRR